MASDHILSGRFGDFHWVDWEGQGPVTHMAHATGFCARVYGPLAQSVSRYLRVVGMDDRGHGRTRALADPSLLRDWEVFQVDLERFFEYLGEPVVAMGHLRGAVVSLKLAARRPDLVRALILLDPPILPKSQAWWSSLKKKMGLAGQAPVAAQTFNPKNDWPSREALLDHWRSSGPFVHWREGFLEGYLADGTRWTNQGQLRLSCEPEWESACFGAFCSDPWDDLARVAVPTLLLHGLSSDVLNTAALKRFRKRLPQATVLGIENSGPYLPMERPKECAQAILNFLKKENII